jgi:hypothetical protein
MTNVVPGGSSRYVTHFVITRREGAAVGSRPTGSLDFASGSFIFLPPNSPAAVNAILARPLGPDDIDAGGELLNLGDLIRGILPPLREAVAPEDELPARGGRPSSPRRKSPATDRAVWPFTARSTTSAGCGWTPAG